MESTNLMGNDNLWIGFMIHESQCTITHATNLLKYSMHICIFIYTHKYTQILCYLVAVSVLTEKLCFFFNVRNSTWEQLARYWGLCPQEIVVNNSYNEEHA